MKKLISLLLSAALVWVCVLPPAVLADDIPAAEEMIYEQHFDGDTVPPDIVCYNNDGTVTQRDGRLIIDRVSNLKNSYTGAELYPDASKNAISGRFVVSFTLSRESDNAVPVPVVFYGAKGYKNPYLSMNWKADDDVTVRYSLTKGTDGSEHSVGSFGGTQLETAVEFNCDNGTFSMWLNGDKVLTDVYPRSAAAVSFWCAYFSLEKENIAAIGLDDFLVWRVKEESDIDPAAAVEADAAALNEESLRKVPSEDGYTEDSLKLPAKGGAGSDIRWVSSNPEIINDSGDLVGMPEEDCEVSLTAFISCGDTQTEKSFDFTVKGMAGRDYSRPTRYRYEDRFDDGEIAEQIVTYQSGGPVEEKDGALWLTYEGGSYTGTDIFLSSDKSEMKGRFAVSFIMEREAGSSGKIPIQFYGASYSTSYMAMNWNGDGSVQLNYADTSGEAGSLKNLGTFDKNRLKVLAEFDFDRQCFSLWLNNTKVLDNKYPRDAAVTSLRSVWIYPDNSAVLRMSVDDFLVYGLMEDMPDEQRVQLDAAALNFDTIVPYPEELMNTTRSDLKLYNIGDYGSRIEWSSSDETLIGSDGSISGNGSGYVLMRAVISSGEAQAVKEILVYVLGAPLPQAEAPGVDETILRDEFDDDSVNPAFAVTEDGGSVCQKDGELVIERRENTGTTIVDMYNDEAQSPAYGMIGTSFTMSRTDSNAVLIRMRGGGASNDYLAATWGASQLTVKIPNGMPGSATTDITAAYCGNTVRIDTLYNTETSRFSLWVDGVPAVRNAYSRYSGVYSHLYTRIYMENTNYNTVKVSDYHVFYAVPGAMDAIETDAEMLSAANLVTQDTSESSLIKTDLTLPQTGQYGSEITWVTGPGIDENGRITRSREEDLNTWVIAVISYDGLRTAKKFDFTLMREFTSDAALLEADAALITYSALTAQDPSAITTALELMPEGKYGTQIVWQSDNEEVISTSGRVIRPYYDKSAKSVTLTAQLSCGSAHTELTFSFTVLPDEEPKDPNYMSDEEFFGVWENGALVREGKLNYELDGLKSVKAAAQNGDYEAAKTVLLEEIRGRENKQSVDMSERNALWAGMVLDEIYHQSGDQYHQGEFLASGGDYSKYEVTVKTKNIAKGSNTSYCIMGRYNENSTFEIATTRNEDASLHPYLELVVNGKTMRISPAADAGIRAGDYMDTNYGTDTSMKVKTMGAFLGNDTYKAMLRFNFSELKESDTVESAKLVLYGRVTPSYVSEKAILVLLEPTNLWENGTATWNNFPGYVFNYNGVDGGNTWNAIAGCDQEYTFQAPRFWAWTPAALEYSITKDEKYVYNALKISMDYICDKGGSMKFTDGAWNGMVIRGGYPRTLDAAIRLQQWSLVLDTFAASRYMTPEICTAMLKHMWDIGYALTLATVVHSPNWMQTENMALLQGALAFPEFSDSEEWIEFACGVLEPMIFANHFDDGSYLESTLGYNESSLKTFMEYKRLMYNNNREVSPEYDEMLKKAAYYACVMKGINGSNIQYGDEQGGTKAGASYSDMVKWYGDTELQYIDSLGTEGTRPDWTSMHFEDSQMTAMRSGWNKNGLALYTNVRGGGDGHGHRDDNTVTVIANDRILLNDAGVFTYTDTDPLRKWGRSTKAHNTVEINNTSQDANWATKAEGGTWGSTQDWSTNSKYDFLSQTTRSYDFMGFSHRRSITFLKSGFWIVSDLIDPADDTKPNLYKQIWHMMPTSAISYNDDTKQIRSNYPTGANMIVASADADSRVRGEEGWYDYTYAQVQDAPFAYFEKSDAVGDTVFDTILMPFAGTSAEIETERIDMGTDPSRITALKFKSNINGEVSNVYYMLDYTQSGETKQFGKYSTDADMAVVKENAQGEITEAVMQNGTVLESESGSVIALERKSHDFSYTDNGVDIEIVFSDDTLTNDMISVAAANAESVYVNGVSKEFSGSGGMVTPGDDDAAEQGGGGNINIRPGTGGDGSQTSGGGAGGGAGGSTGGTGSSGGNGGAGGGAGSSGSGTGGSTGGTGSSGSTGGNGGNAALMFDDIAGHWAKQQIEAMAKEGIAKGDGASFYPDRQITRAEAVALAVRCGNFEQAEYQGEFNDVTADEWYSGAVAAALKEGIISKDDTFRPDDNITREELTKIMIILAQRMGTDVRSESISFTDSGDISEWAVPYVEMAYGSGIIRGMGDGTFLPRENATRAEVITVIYQLKNTAVNGFRIGG